MTISRKSLVAFFAMAIAIASVSSTYATSTFRGIPRVQTLSDGTTNRLESDSLNLMTDNPGGTFLIDVKDSFDRTGSLNATDAGDWAVGFVPPRATWRTDSANGIQDGLLTGQDAIDHGRWTAGSSYQTTGGAVQRTTGVGVEVASVPWRVEPSLGDYYLLESTAMVAQGETVSVGYFGDIDTHGTAQGINGSVGQLVLNMSRGTGAASDEVTWTVAWDINGVQVQTGSTTTVADGDEIKMQLGWLDQGNNDLFDAWIESDTTGTTMLTSGSMGTAIDVYAVGFELNGTGSSLTGFTAAVPEPSAGFMGIIGMVGMLSVVRRRR